MSETSGTPGNIPRGGRIDTERDFKPVRIAVLTASDTRTIEDDTSGAALVERIGRDGHEIADRAVTTDDVGEIRAKISEWIAREDVDAIITTGGTGLTGRDGMPEAVRPLLDKEMEGFAIVWHMLSYRSVGLSTLQSRALAGVSQGTFIFCLPGSTGACREAWDGIIKDELDARQRPCNLVELMPRLLEN